MAIKKTTSVLTPTLYDLVTSPNGYFNKREITNQDARALVKGSQNVFINDEDKVATRKGFTIDGQEHTGTKKIDSNYDYISKNGKKILRSFQGQTPNTGKLQVRTEYVPGTILYQDLLTTLTYTEFDYTTWWNDAESVRVLIFVDGTTSIRMWGGGVAYILSATAATLTKTGTDTWAQAGFFINVVGRTVTIPGIGTFAYTGGETTTTLTGLVGLPAITAGTPAFQGVITVTTLAGVAVAITPNLVMTKDNQVWYGDTRTSVIWGSKNTDYTDCSFTTPLRVPGEGFKIVVDNYVVGFIQDDEQVFVFAGLDDLYKITFELSSAQTAEAITIKKLRAGASSAAISKKAIIPVKNGIMYITNSKNLTWLTTIENIVTPQSLPTSDPIKDDFDDLDMRGATGIFFENEIVITFPAENLVYRYDFDKLLWQAPMTLSLSGFSIIKNELTQMNELYGHSNSVNESYKLNDGLDDNGVDIEFIAAFAYRQFGNRAVLHQFDEFYVELYMSISTILTCTHNYVYLGSELVIIKTISGTDRDLQFSPQTDANLGKDNLGKNPLGSTLFREHILNKYRCIHEIKSVDFFEHQVVFSSGSSGAQFQILSHGPNVRNSTNIPRSIKR